MPSTSTKTQRILIIYHLLRHCDEVSVKELEDNIPRYCKKTFSCDIALLKKAGVPVRYSAKQRSFILNDKGFVQPSYLRANRKGDISTS